MQERPHIVSAEVVSLIEQTVRESMAPFGFQAARVRAGEDHDGDPVIFVDVDYVLSETPVDFSVVNAMRTTLRDRLWAAGETRFPHVRNHFAEDQQIRPRRRARA